MTDYILPQAPDRLTEQRRLELLQAYNEGPTTRALEAVGVAEGWHCLDAGAGAGSVSRWLAGRVGDSGSVLAVDLDTTLLSEDTNLTARRLDVRTEELPADAFDLVHARLLLTHLPEREDVLDRLLRATRPGGWVMIGDIDFSTVRLSRDDAIFEKVIDSYGTVSRKAGGDPVLGPALPAMLERHGVVGVRAEVFQTYQRGGDAAATLLGLTFERLRERVLDHGVAADDLDHFNAVLRDPSSGIHSPTIWTVWGRR